MLYQRIKKNVQPIRSSCIFTITTSPLVFTKIDTIQPVTKGNVEERGGLVLKMHTIYCDRNVRFSLLHVIFSLSFYFLYCHLNKGKNTLKKGNTEHHIMKVMTPFHGTFKLGIHCKVPPIYYMFDTANYVFPATVHKDTVPMSSQFRAKKKKINNVII